MPRKKNTYQYDMEPCGWCGDDFMPTPAQRKRVRNGKLIYCCEDCKLAKLHSSREPKPWDWLKVPHLMHNLATEEYEEQYVGY